MKKKMQATVDTGFSSKEAHRTEREFPDGEGETSVALKEAKMEVVLGWLWIRHRVLVGDIDDDFIMGTPFI